MTPSEAAQPMLVLNVDSLTDDQLASARKLHRELSGVERQGVAHIRDDPQRHQLDRRSWGGVIRTEMSAEVDELAEVLRREPLMTARH